MISNISSEPGDTLCSKAGFNLATPNPRLQSSLITTLAVHPWVLKKALRSKGLLTLRSYPALKGEIC